MSDVDELENHVHWDVFDEPPYTALIPEIGYQGVSRYFKNEVSPPARQFRSQKRMAEFLVRNAVPLDLVSCIIVKDKPMRDMLKPMMDGSRWSIPIHVKPGCFFQ